MNHFVGEEDLAFLKRVGDLLISRNLSVSTAESCTGGRIASLITSVAGSSAYFKGGIVSYSNEVKIDVLGVPKSDVEEYGAVSKPVVEGMARGAMRVLGSDCSVATSGIAGPGGGTPEKPVGTVWIAVAIGNRIESHCFHFTGDRQEIIRQSTEKAFKILIRILNCEL